MNSIGDKNIKRLFRKHKLALLFGVLTLILFAAKPYLLDLIAPAKSLGRIIGENTKDLIDAMNNIRQLENGVYSKRDVWSNVLSIVGFVFFALTLFLSLDLLKTDNKWYGIGAIALAAIGLFAFFTYLAISFVAFLLIAILVAVLVLGGGSL